MFIKYYVKIKVCRVFVDIKTKQILRIEALFTLVIILSSLLFDKILIPRLKTAKILKEVPTFLIFDLLYLKKFLQHLKSHSYS